MQDRTDTTATPSDTTSLPPYVAPAVTVLGTLADLTQGGNVDGSPDGFGFSGDSGSV